MVVYSKAMMSPLPAGTALPATFPTNGGLPLPFPLCAGLFVETPLTQFRIQTGTLDFPLKTSESPFEAFILLNDDFQGESPSDSAVARSGRR